MLPQSSSPLQLPLTMQRHCLPGRKGGGQRAKSSKCHPSHPIHRISKANGSLEIAVSNSNGLLALENVAFLACHRVCPGASLVLLWASMGSGSTGGSGAAAPVPITSHLSTSVFQLLSPAFLGKDLEHLGLQLDFTACLAPSRGDLHLLPRTT